MANRFEGVEDVQALLHQMIGSASMCWEKVSAAGVFDMEEASRIADEGFTQLCKIMQIFIDDLAKEMVDNLQESIDDYEESSDENYGGVSVGANHGN